MGCNCKSQQVQSRPQIIREGTVNIVSQPSKPNYTREQIDRALNYVREITNSPMERKWTMDFHNSQFSDHQVPNCVNCWERVKTRMEHLNEKLTEYEQYESSRTT
jgi:hypothetical protein